MVKPEKIIRNRSYYAHPYKTSRQSSSLIIRNFCFDVISNRINMNYSKRCLFAAIYACSFLLPLVVSELKMTVVLNKGVLPTKEGYTCTANDSLLIQNAIKSGDDDDDRRELKTKTQCKSDCQGYATGSCHVTGCKGFRRQLQQDQRKKRLLGNRKMYDDDAVCSYAVSVLNKKLDALLPNLSASCRPVVQSNRVVSCFDDVRYAKIESFNLWNADTDTVVATNIQNSATFCYTNSNLNIEAVANACVKEVDMRLSGPVSESEDSEDTAPYTIFGFDDDNRKNLYGRRLPIGTYSISTEIEDSDTPKAKVTFSIKKC